MAELSSGAGGGRGRDTTAFTVAFKGVFLEGLEVVVIVLTLGATEHRLGLAALAALAAVVLVGAVGAIVARQLSGVPENALKATVGLMLVSYGTFWTGEGIGVHWPGVRPHPPRPGRRLRGGGVDSRAPAGRVTPGPGPCHVTVRSGRARSAVDRRGRDGGRR